MDRNREARRGNMAAMNGGLSRRRQRTSGLRDSPEEDGGMELQETTRLRDRRNKKDRDRERSSRSKRRGGERMLLTSNRDEVEDSSEDSFDEEDEDEDDEPVSAGVRPPVASSSLPVNPHSRKSFALKVASSLPAWKVADEMIGVPVPRKARSASVKRSHESSLSGGGGSGADQIHRQASTSPLRPITGSTAPVSPSSSNASVRKKMRQISGNKPRPPKVGKPPSSIQEIDMEVAEVLYGLATQFKQEIQKPDSKDINGSTYEVKSKISSPNSFSPQPPTSQSSIVPTFNSGSSGAPLPTIAPKRKRPRPVNDGPISSPNLLLAVPSTSISSTSKMDVGLPTKMDVSSPKLEENMASSMAAENGGGLQDSSLSNMVGTPAEVRQVSTKTGNNIVPELKPLMPECDGVVQNEPTTREIASASKEPSQVELNVDLDEAAPAKDAATVHVEKKFRIDLMAPPPRKSSPDVEGLSRLTSDRMPFVEVGMDTKVDNIKIEEGRVESSRKPDALEYSREEKMQEKSMQQDFELKKQVFKERTVDLLLDIEKQDNSLHVSKQLVQKQQSKSTRTEGKPDKAAQAASLSLPMAVTGWPGGLPPFGFVGQVPSVPTIVPVDGSPRSSKSMQPPHFLPAPPLRPKRCATHCYITQNIQYHQQLARISTSTFWPAASGATPIYGTKPYNLNVMPPSESAILGNPLQGGFPGRSLQDKGVPVVANFSGHSSNDKNVVAGTFMDVTPQRKQLVLQQGLQAGSTSNMVHAPAFIFPLNQQAAAVKSTAGVSNLPPSSAPSSTVVSSGSAVVSAPPVSFNYGSLPPNEAQYLAILQNNAYPFPIPAHVGAHQSHPYRGGSHAQFPFFNGSFYASQMLHPSQLQQQQPSPQQLLQAQQPPPSQHGHQNSSTSSGSSSSQKHSQQAQRAPGGGTCSTGGSAAHDLPASKQRLQLQQARHLETETGGEDSPSTADSRVSQGQKGINGHNFAMPPHPQNFGLMSTAKGPPSGGVNQNEKQNEKHHQLSQQQNMKVELTSSHPFAMSFANFSGGGASAPPAMDFSSLAQNHALFQSLPEAARQYQMAAAAAAAQVVQLKKTHHQINEDGKTVVDSMTVNAPIEATKVLPAGKALGSISQHTLAFSRPDSDHPASTILGNSVIESSARTLNLIPGSVNGTRPSNRAASGTPASGAVTAVSSGSNSQHQQQLIQLQKKQMQHQQQYQQQLASQQYQQQLASRTKSAISSNTSSSAYSDRLTPATTGTRFPSASSGFPQVVQGNSPNQSPQWKNSTRTITSAPSATPPPPAPAKSHLPQQPSRSTQPNPSTSCHASGHQSQISFGVNSLKAAAAASGQQFSAVNSNPSPPSAAAAVGSPPISASKSTGGSPRASTGSKRGPQTPTLPFQQHPQAQPAKNSPSVSNLKSSPGNNRNAPSILGPPHTSSGSGLSTKQQTQQQKQPYPQAQLFFSGPYVQGQTFQPNPPFFQRRLSEPLLLTPQQQQQSSSTPSSTGTLIGSPALTLAGATSTSDPAKAVAAAAGAANSIKGLPQAGILHAAQFAAQAGGGPHPLMSASGFPYLHAMSSMSVKPPDHKPAAGNDNLHACWQPEKR